jgi:hypothetical protein
LGFGSTRCLGHLCYDNDSCKHFFHFAIRNKVSWTGDSAQIPLAGQFAQGPPVCTIVCRFYVASPFCVNTCLCQIYHVIHKLQSLSRATIHLGTHEHLVTKGMCREALEEIKVLVEG